MRTTLIVGLLFLGCGPNLASSSEGDAESIDAELAGELKAAVPSLTVWVRPTMTDEVRDGRREFVVRGRASQNLEGLNAFIFDDVYGQAQTLSARTFEIRFDANAELRGLLAGVRTYLSLTPVDHSKYATASLLYAPSFTSLSGSSGIWVRKEVTPISVGGQLVLRARVRSAGTLTSSAGTVSRRSGDEWNVDFTAEQWRDAGQVTFTSGTKTKKGTAVTAPVSLALTRDDIEVVWPQLQCTPEMRACLDALPATQLDTESCGSYFAVTRCVR